MLLKSRSLLFKPNSLMKSKHVVFFILLLLIIDQTIKVYIKTHFYYGEKIKVFDWFRLHFIENPGMAWGWKLGEGDVAKVVLTLFRLVTVIWGTFYIKKIIKAAVSQRFYYLCGFYLCRRFRQFN